MIMEIDKILKRMRKADIKNGLIVDNVGDVNAQRNYAQEEEDYNALQTHINQMGGAEYGV